MKPINKTLRSWLFALSAGTILSSTLTVQAATYNFIGTTNGAWHTATNWQGGATPTFNNAADLKFGVNFAMATNASWLSTNNRTVRSLEFGNISSALTINLGSDNGNTTPRVLTFDTDSGDATILVNNTVSANMTIGSPGTVGSITLADNLVVTANNASGVLVLNKPIAESGGSKTLTKEGIGFLQLAASNTFTGKVTVNGGFIRFNGDDRLGAPPVSPVADQVTLNGGTLRSFAALTLDANRGITLGPGGGSIQVFTGDLTCNSTITGAGSLTTTGDSTTRTLALEAANDYLGTTTISSGVLRLQPGGSIPATSNLTINGTGNFNVRNTGGWLYTGTITGDDTGTINLNSGTNATLAGNISGVTNVNANSAGTNTAITGNISGIANVNAQNTDGPILHLSGTNSYSGNTTVQNTSTLFINGDNSGATGPVIVSAGGTLRGSGTVGGTTTISGTHVPGGGVSGVQTFTSGISYAAASTLTVELGTNSSAPGVRGITPAGYSGVDVTGGSVSVDPAATASVALNSATGDLNLSNAFWNSAQQWPVVDVKGSATAADANAPALAGVTLNGSSFDSAAYGSFSFFRAAGSTSENSVWLQWTPATPPTWTGAGGTSWATAGNWTPAAPGADGIARFHTSSTSNLNTVLGADFNLLGLTVINPSGPVSVGGGNTLTLGTGGIDLAFATRNLTVTAPVILGAAQTWTIASGRTASINGGLSGAFAVSIAGAGTVSLGAAVDPLVAMTVASGSTLKMGVSGVLSSDPTAVNLTLNGTLDLNGTSQSVNAIGGSGIIDNTAAGAAQLTVGTNDTAATLGAVIQNTNGPLALVKTGSTILTLTAANSFSGGFTNNGSGNVAPHNDNAFGTGPVVSNAGTIYPTLTGTFANNLTLSNSTLRIGGGGSKTITWNGPVTATGTSGISADGGTAGITLGSTLDITGATFTSFANATTNNINGDISGAGGNLSISTGTHQLSGSNSYTGTTTVATGVLRLQATGTISSSSNVVINTAGNFNIRNTVGWVYSGNITGDGSGQINLNSGTNATLAGGITGVALIVANSSGTDTIISGAVGGAAALSVQGGAILRLAGSNSYSGATNVTSGTLLLAANNVLPDGTPVSIGIGTLDAATLTDTAGTLDVTNAASAINLGPAAALAFADSSAVDWSGGTLNITGTFVSGSSLRFGTTAAGLTDDQLLQITAPGFTGFDLNATGYLVATAIGSPYDTWKSQITNGLNLRTDDADGDGYTNLQEFLFGTSPIAGNGSLLTTTPSGGNLILRWLQRESGSTNTLLQSATLAGGSWTPVVSPLPAADVDQSGVPADYDRYTVTLPTSGGKWFFRVEGVEN